MALICKPNKCVPKCMQSSDGKVAGAPRKMNDRFERKVKITNTYFVVIRFFHLIHTFICQETCIINQLQSLIAS